MPGVAVKCDWSIKFLLIHHELRPSLECMRIALVQKKVRTCTRHKWESERIGTSKQCSLTVEKRRLGNRRPNSRPMGAGYFDWAQWPSWFGISLIWPFTATDRLLENCDQTTRYSCYFLWGIQCILHNAQDWWKGNWQSTGGYFRKRKTIHEAICGRYCELQ